jgi:signal transduction histidine kinase
MPNRFSFHLMVLCIALCVASLPGAISCAQQPAANTGTENKTINDLLFKAKAISNPDSAIRKYKNVLEVSLNAGYWNGAATALMGIGLKYFEKSSFDTGLDYIKQAYPYCVKSAADGSLGRYYSNTAIYYSYLGNYVEASANYYKALEEFNKVFKTPTTAVAVVYLNLAHLNKELQQYDKALGYYSKGLAIIRSGNHPYELAGALNNIGNVYIMKKMPDSAKKCFIEAIDTAEKYHLIAPLASAEMNLGGIYFEEGYEEKGIALLIDASKLVKNTFPFLEIEVSYSLGEVWTRQKKFKDAEHILLSSIEKARSLKLKDYVIKGTTKLFELYVASGQYKKAIVCQDTIAVLKDSLLSAEKARAINLMEIKYKTSEKDGEIAANRLLIEQQKNKLARRNTWTIGTVSGILILMLILGWLYRRSRHKQYILTQQVKSLQQENKIEVLKAMLDGEEQERSRIAKELHDGIGGMLSATLIRFTTVDENETDKISSQKEVLGLLEEMGDEIRKTAHNLVPGVLMKQTLSEALCSYCNVVQNGSGLQIDFQSHGNFDDMEQDVKLNTYRIIQELLKNIIQHANATYVLVQLIVRDEVLTITVEDNGAGFNQSDVKSGIGLYNLKSRVHILNGSYTIDSGDKGTSVYIEFDLRKTKTKV